MTRKSYSTKFSVCIVMFIILGCIVSCSQTNKNKMVLYKRVWVAQNGLINEKSSLPVKI